MEIQVQYSDSEAYPMVYIFFMYIAFTLHILFVLQWSECLTG